MGFKYLNNLTTPENIQKFLDFADLAAGAGQDFNNVFDMSEKFNQSRPMERCHQALKKDPASAKMLAEKYVGPLYDLDEM
ncbi:MAG: hypothetical protein ACFBSE_20900 [Prochloraceae cyanobacterium]